MWNLNEVATSPDCYSPQPDEVSTRLFDASYEGVKSITSKSTELADFRVADGAAPPPSGSGSVSEMESALTNGIETIRQQAETNSVTTRFDKDQQRNDGRDFWLKHKDPDGDHSLQVETKYQYELRTGDQGVPRVQMVGEKWDFGNITYKMQDGGDALVRVKYGDLHDPKGPLVQPGDQFWIYVPGRNGQEAFIYPATKWGKFGPQGAGHDGAKFQEDLKYINSHLKKPAGPT